MSTDRTGSHVAAARAGIGPATAALGPVAGEGPGAMRPERIAGVVSGWRSDGGACRKTTVVATPRFIGKTLRSRIR